MQKKAKEWKQKIYWLVFAIIAIVIFKLLDNLGDITEWVKALVSVLMPFIMAILIAYLFYLPCRAAERFFSKSKSKFIRKRSRWLGIFTIYLIVILAVVLMIKFIVPTVYESFTELAAALPGYYNTMMEMLKDIPEDSILNNIDWKAIIENMSSINIQDYLNFERITEYAKGIIRCCNYYI